MNAAFNQMAIKEENTPINMPVSRAKLFFHGAIVNHNDDLAKYILDNQPTKFLYEKDKFGYNSVIFSKRHGTQHIQDYILSKIKDNFVAKTHR